MKTIIETPNFNAKDSLTDFVKLHVEKLETLSDQIVESRVFLKLDKFDNKENKVCEIKVSLPGNDLFASKHADSFEEAVTLSVDALKHQLKRWKHA
ncbi:HPF/RaiA family ribosome-associated protein [Imperialibacter roseus]|mgnify:CR=1 FL=1|uniref:HPF/RaiA family ribosome-associated protein n=1 Tax=Imperialibacter roseus TaxID=1324217 RepID=A0ABZ0IYN7_9BACT|nr:HPF/RaiA family ribosome-associated protein [Imperialibacter roseus]WOK09485.1 HPF/RaiA family ribosome-associated protein [Imperialibacter roseus]|tara:strand:- start:4578 stop:4865 length:288 start_codon:yes stop_codon:yes gene_type:complete